MIMAIEKLPSIKRKDCRDHVVKNFSIDTMVDNYNTALENIVGKKGKTFKKSTLESGKALHKKVRKISQKLLNP